MREDSPDPYEPKEVIGEYDDGHIVYYFCKRVDGIAHKVRAFVSPQPTRSNASAAFLRCFKASLSEAAARGTRT